MDIMSTRQKKYHQGKVTIPKAAVPILRLFDEDHESPESGYAVPVGSIRWTAREESLCCSFLQTQMQTSPNDTRDQLLRATSVYLVTEGYFRNPKRIYVHLREKARHLGLYETTSLKHCDTCGTRCIKAGNCRKCNPIKCVSCGGNTPSWLKECSRCNDKAKRLRGRTSSGADQNRCIDCGVKFLPFPGESIRCASCLKRHEARLAAKAICSDCGRRGRVGKKRCEVCQKACVKRRAQNDGRARKKRRGTRLITNAVFCLDCGEQLPVPVHTKKRCSSCQYKFGIDNKRKRRAKKRAARGIPPPVCCDCEGPGRHNKPRCEPCQKKIEDESKAADFLEALGRPDAICCDCGEPGRVGKQRCASSAVKLRNDRRRERQKRKKAAQPTVDKPEPICCDCRGRAQIGINGRPKKRCAPCELEEKKARGRRFEERRHLPLSVLSSSHGRILSSSLIVADEIPFASSCVSADAYRGRPGLKAFSVSLGKDRTWTGPKSNKRCILLTL